MSFLFSELSLLLLFIFSNALLDDDVLDFCNSSKNLILLFSSLTRTSEFSLYSSKSNISFSYCKLKILNIVNIVNMMC